MADEKVVFEIHADDSDLEKEMNRAGKTVTESAAKTAEAQKKKQKEVTNEVKQSSAEQSSAVDKSQKHIEKTVKDTNSAIETSTRHTNQNLAHNTSETGDKIVRKHKQDAEELKKHVEEYEEKAKKTADTVKKEYLAIGTAAATSSVAAMKEAAKAETSFAKVKTLLSDKVITDNYYAQMKAVSKETGLAFADLSESVYSAISASIDESKAVDFSKTANKLAKGGFTQAATAVDVLTTAINAYSKSAEDADHISDVLITTQNLGKTTVDELASSMGQTIPIANAVNASIEDLSAQYAVLTKNGIGTAEAGTKIKAMLAELSSSSSNVSKTLKELTGKSFADLQNEGKTTADILNILADHAKSSGKSISDLFSSVEAGSAALTLIKDGGDDFNNILAQMENSAGATEKAYQIMSDTLEEKFNKLKNKFVLAITEVGEELLPYADEFADYIDEHSEEIAEVIRDVGAAAGELTKALGEGVKFLWEHKEAVIAAATAYAAFKTAIAIGSTINTTATAINNVGKAMEALPALAGKASTNVSGAISKIGTVATSTAGMITIAATEAIVIAKALYDEWGKMDERVEKLVGSTDELRRGIDDTIRGVEAENDIIRAKAEEYEALRTKLDRTADEEKRLKDISEDLQKSLGSEIEVVNGLTGEYNDLSSALEDYLEKKIKKRELEEKEEAAMNAKKRLAEIEKLKEELTAEYYDTSLGNIGFFGYLDESFNNGRGREAKWVDSIRALNAEAMDLQGVYADWENAYNDYYGVVGDSTTAVNDHTEALAKSAAQINATAVAADKAAVSYSDLAKGTEDIIKQNQTLYDILDKVKNGEALSYEEVQKLIAVSPDLADKISLTTEGYIIEKSALEGLNSALGNSIQAQLDAERQKTLAAIGGARERIKIYEREIEAMSKLGKNADQDYISKRKAAINEQLEYIDGLSAKLEADKSLPEYMQNVAAGSGKSKSSGGSGSSSAPTEAEKEFDTALEALNHKKATGGFEGNEEAYWEEYRTLAEKLPTDNKRYWRYEEDRYSYEQSLKKDSQNAGKGSSSGSGTVISIDSYVPTIWDDDATASKKSKTGKKIESALRGINGKIANELENIKSPQAETSTTLKASNTSATLADVIKAIKDSSDPDKKPKTPLYIELKARDLTIGTVAVADINDMTRRDGKSPLMR